MKTFEGALTLLLPPCTVVSPTSTSESFTVENTKAPKTTPGNSSTATLGQSDPRDSQQLPWYRAGGLNVNLCGMALQTVYAVTLLVGNMRAVSSHHTTFLLCLWLCQITAATLLTGRTAYCSFVVPTYLTSAALVAYLPHPPVLLVVSVALAMVKINICMSVCLHRYAAHQAFTCGPMTKIGVLLFGCLANQCGPLWWASQHRCHHK
jgi:hypothetical protein